LQDSVLRWDKAEVVSALATFQIFKKRAEERYYREPFSDLPVVLLDRGDGLEVSRFNPRTMKSAEGRIPQPKRWLRV